MLTGPNQLNNVLCFPFIFRGALDCGATAINEEMKIACVKAIAELAHAEVSEVVANAYQNETLKFGPEYIIPKPFDPRLVTVIPPAVAKAAMDSNVAKTPIVNMFAYQDKLNRFVFRSGSVMKGVFNVVRENPRRLIYSGGGDERVLRCIQTLQQDDSLAPILIGQRDTVEETIREVGLQIRIGRDFELIDPNEFNGYSDLTKQYHSMLGRDGVWPADAEVILRNNPTALGAMLLQRGDADAMIAGPRGNFQDHFKQIKSIIGLQEGVQCPAAMNLLILENGTYFVTDSYINYQPTAEEIVEITLLASAQVRRFGLTPKVALLSHSNFGSSGHPSAKLMRRAKEILEQQAPDLEVEGEMRTDAALSEDIRNKMFPNSRLKGEANLLIAPNLDAANITFKGMKAIGRGVSIGPILLGMDKPVHILTRTATSRGTVNLSALAAADAAFNSQVLV